MFLWMCVRNLIINTTEKWVASYIPTSVYSMFQRSTFSSEWVDGEIFSHSVGREINPCYRLDLHSVQIVCVRGCMNCWCAEWAKFLDWFKHTLFHLTWKGIGQSLWIYSSGRNVALGWRKFTEVRSQKFKVLIPYFLDLTPGRLSADSVLRAQRQKEHRRQFERWIVKASRK